MKDLYFLTFYLFEITIVGVSTTTFSVQEVELDKWVVEEELKNMEAAQVELQIIFSGLSADSIIMMYLAMTFSKEVLVTLVVI